MNRYRRLLNYDTNCLRENWSLVKNLLVPNININYNNSGGPLPKGIDYERKYIAVTTPFLKSCTTTFK